MSGPTPSVRRTWTRRALLALAVAAVLVAAASVLDFEPDPLQVALIGALGVGVLVLLADTVPESPPAWRDTTPEPVRVPGQDARTTAYLRALEAHRVAREPSPAVRDRLGVLADHALRARHGLDRRDPRAAALLGPDLLDVLDGPVRRLGHHEIDRCLRRIEDL